VLSHYVLPKVAIAFGLQSREWRPPAATPSFLL
jgi:hypothetical protein